MLTRTFVISSPFPSLYKYFFTQLPSLSFSTARCSPHGPPAITCDSASYLVAIITPKNKNSIADIGRQNTKWSNAISLLNTVFLFYDAFIQSCFLKSMSWISNVQKPNVDILITMHVLDDGKSLKNKQTENKHMINASHKKKSRKRKQCEVKKTSYNIFQAKQQKEYKEKQFVLICLRNPTFSFISLHFILRRLLFYTHARVVKFHMHALVFHCLTEWKKNQVAKWYGYSVIQLKFEPYR